MFLDEPEGNSFSDLNQYLGFASAVGSAIDILLKNGKKHTGYVNHSQSSLPNFLEIFTPKGDVDKEIIKIKTEDIHWFKLKRHGKMDVYIDKDGIATSKMPVLMIMAKEIIGNGKIINPGTTAIYGDNIDFRGTISSGRDKKDE